MDGLDLNEHRDLDSVGDGWGQFMLERNMIAGNAAVDIFVVLVLAIGQGMIMILDCIKSPFNITSSTF